MKKLFLGSLALSMISFGVPANTFSTNPVKRDKRNIQKEEQRIYKDQKRLQHDQKMLKEEEAKLRKDEMKSSSKK